MIIIVKFLYIKEYYLKEYYIGILYTCINAPPIFAWQKEKKERISKQNLFKGCYQGQNVTVLAILERLEFKNSSGRPAMVAGNTCQCSMAPAL